ncbi:MAG: transposase [Patescibacteria group bacterium]|nr:transposase [Patescibacteria group bacterium]
MVTLICGVILSPGRRTVASALRAVGLADDETFGKYHRVLSRDRWSALHLSKFLLLLLLSEFIKDNQTVEILVDETLERRRGKKLAYKAWFRDAVRSTQTTTVTTPGIRWLCLCLLVTVPWSKRRWALPFCTVPVCSRKNCLKRGRTWRGGVGLTVDLIIKVRQWLGQSRRIRLIGDGGFTNNDLMLHCIAQKVEQIGRLRLDAALYDDPPVQPKGKRGRKPSKGARQAAFKQRLADPNTEWNTVDIDWYGGERKTVEIATGTALWHVSNNQPAKLRWVLVRPAGNSDSKKAAAFFSTDPQTTPERIVECYAQRWNIEVFFEEVRACLGFETQRGWCNKTIGRTTPCLFGVFSIVVVLAKRLFPQDLPVRQTAWYTKDDATFRDALSAVREHLWRHNIMLDSKINKTGSRKTDDLCLIPRIVFEALQSVACNAA